MWKSRFERPTEHKSDLKRSLTTKTDRRHTQNIWVRKDYKRLEKSQCCRCNSWTGVCSNQWHPTASAVSAHSIPTSAEGSAQIQVDMGGWQFLHHAYLSGPRRHTDMQKVWMGLEANSDSKLTLRITTVLQLTLALTYPLDFIVGQVTCSSKEVSARLQKQGMLGNRKWILSINLRERSTAASLTADTLLHSHLWCFWHSWLSVTAVCATKRVQRVLGLFRLLGFTELDKIDPAKRSHEAGYQLSKLTQVFPTYTWAHSHKRGGVSACGPITNLDGTASGSRAASFQYEEQTNNSDEKQLRLSGRSEKKSAMWKCKKFMWRYKGWVLDHKNAVQLNKERSTH